MGLYDRDYARPGRSTWDPLADWSLVGKLILLNVVIWGIDQIPVQLLFAVEPGLPNRGAAWLQPWLELRTDSLLKPWEWYRLLTYGFVHDVVGVSHILFNMFMLWLFGSDLEGNYGRREFLRFYLTAIVVSGIVWCAVRLAAGERLGSCVGASGAVIATAVLLALHYPWRIILVMFVLPMPMCVLAGLIVFMDLMGVVHKSPDGVAHTAHLAGAVFAYCYYYYQWNLTRLTDRFWPFKAGGRRPAVRVHVEPEADEPDDDRTLDAEVDRILAKMKASGESSLSRAERQTLERASRRYRDRRR